MTGNCITQASLLISMVFFSTTEAKAQKKPLDPCCGILAVDVRTGVVTAKVNATGNVFEFKASNPATVTTLKPGQPVFANFANHQISLDGRTAYGTMTSAPRPAANTSTGPVALPTIAARIDPIRLPPVSYGEPQPIQSVRGSGGLSEIRPVTTRVGGRNVTSKVLRLHGLAGIQQARDLPEGARRLLEIHVQKLGPNESHDYIINTELAAQWMASHPHVPDDIQPPSGSSRQSCSGSDYVTKINCDKQAAGDAVNGIQDLANGTWNHASDELTHDWQMAQGCFADQTLPLSGIPVKFSITPNLTIPLSSVANGAGVSTSTHSESSSTKVDGSVGLGFPMQSDFTAKLELFYIPFLPFVVRPKSIAADGTMLVGETLTASVIASGKFDKTLKIPPTGGPKIPIEMIPIVIAGVPVAELDVSAYIEGNVEVGGSGKADGHFQISNPHKAQFAFSCNGGGCASSAQQIPDPHDGFRKR